MFFIVTPNIKLKQIAFDFTSKIAKQYLKQLTYTNLIAVYQQRQFNHAIS